MRKKVKKETRFAVIGVFVLLIIISSFLAYTAFRTPETYEKEVVLHRYRQSADFNYLVYLKPNSLYNQSVITGKKIYFSKITDHIEITLNYSFTGGNATTDCQVIAELSTDKWSKSFPLNRITAGNNFSLTTSINLTRFAQEVNRIEKELGVFSRERLLKKRW